MHSQINKFSRRIFIGITTAALIVACNSGGNQSNNQQSTDNTANDGSVNIYSSRHL